MKKLARDDSDNTTWSSFRIALKTIWKKDEIEELCKRLDGYRQQLALRLLVVLNAKYDRQVSESANRLDSIETSNQRIVEIVTFTQSLLETAMSSGSNDINRIIKRYMKTHGREEGELIEQGDQRLCEEAFSAILTLEDGTTRTIADLSRPSDQTIGLRKKRNLHRLTTFRDESHSLAGGGISVNEFAPLAREVMLSLQFRMIHVRIDSVAEAHRTTFQWIFDENKNLGRGINFVKWLKAENGIYWISGKAGSGKSTLMKSIVLHKDTKKHLQSWAGDHQLAMASFFFWSPGTQLQKSLEGLLRALLADLLKQFPYLIPNVFPDLCREITAKNNLSGAPEYELNIVELKSAFRNLLKYSKGTIKICLFVDGLDEYSGDHADICAFLIDITNSPGSPIKIVISSRPWVVISDALQHFPHIRLQDLTRSDIEFYVSDKLNGNAGMKALTEWQPTIIADLSASTCKRASGVFLWVVLAVRSLLEGLTYGDRVSELHERLKSLPTDLGVFYTQIINSLEPRVRTDAARTFMIMLRSTEVQGDNPIELLQLVLADDTDPKAAISSPMEAMSETRRAALCEIMRRRIDVRSRGLLEIHGRSSINIIGRSVVTDYVEFLHRTVVDFLRTVEMWELLSSLAGASFDPHMSLLSSCLMEAKILPIESRMLFNSDLVIANMRQAFACARALEVKNLTPCTDLLDDLEKTISAHWNGAEQYKVVSRSEPWGNCRDKDWRELAISETGFTRVILKDVGPAFIRLSIYSGCVLYATEKVTSQDTLTKADRSASLLDVILHFFQSPDENKVNHITAIRRLLPLVDLNLSESNWSVWSQLLHYASMWNRKQQKVRLERTVQHAIEVSTIFLHFLEAGAPRTRTVTVTLTNDDKLLITVTSVLDDLLNALTNMDTSGFTGSAQEVDDFRFNYEKIRSLLSPGRPGKVFKAGTGKTQNNEKMNSIIQNTPIPQKRRLRFFCCWS